MKTNSRARIGIVGGMGPAAGWDLACKITRETFARTDQEHLDVIVASLPSGIADRTEYLSGRTGSNPATGIIQAVDLLLLCRATIIGIPCNTSHAPQIFDPVRARIDESRTGAELVNMIEEVAVHIRDKLPGVSTVGILATTGTVASQVYTATFNRFKLTVLYPEADDQERLVHRAIYDPDYGIKAQSQITDRSRISLLSAVKLLVGKGAECIVLGCTELPLAVTAEIYDGVPIVDATRILARALINKATSRERYT
jgi:aspartate racemase